MPVEFLNDEQVAEYGRFVRPPSRSELERFFLLNDRDRELVEQRRRSHNRLGFAIQLGTVRFLGTFLPDPLDAPTEVVVYQAGQLGIDVSGLRAYAEREMTPLEHAWEIRREYGYRDFAEAEEEPLDRGVEGEASYRWWSRFCRAWRISRSASWRTSRTRLRCLLTSGHSGWTAQRPTSPSSTRTCPSRISMSRSLPLTAAGPRRPPQRSSGSLYA
jgi:Domain of unknown function (DUF4158)